MYSLHQIGNTRVRSRNDAIGILAALVSITETYRVHENVDNIWRIANGLLVDTLNQTIE